MIHDIFRVSSPSCIFTHKWCEICDPKAHKIRFVLRSALETIGHWQGFTQSEAARYGFFPVAWTSRGPNGIGLGQVGARFGSISRKNGPWD